MTKGHEVGWTLFRELDERAAAVEATTGDMLDVAAVILAGYMIRLRDTMEQHHADAEQLARCDAACWEALKDRARLMVEFLEPVGRGPIH